jgi:hypothetical protein
MVLRLEKRFVPLPVLHEALVKGEVSANKLVRIAPIATKENESELVEQIKSLPQKAVEVMAKEIQQKSYKENENQIGLFKPENGSNSMRAQGFAAAESQQKANYDFKLLSILSPEIKAKLNELHEKGIDINNLLTELLAKRELEIAQQKEEIATEQYSVKMATRKKEGGIVTKQYNGKITVQQPSKSRYIATKVRQIIRQEYGTKCSIPHCSKPSKILHHTARFALTHSHDPRFIAPLCEGHHVLAHAIDVRVQGARWGVHAGARD